MPRLADRFAGLVVPALLSVAYTGLVLAFWTSAKGGFDSLDNVARCFETRELLLAGWIHYLAFDLFVGAWIVRTARQARIPFWLVVPCLVLTFLFGPAGLLTFVAIRAARSRRTPSPLPEPSRRSSMSAIAIDCLTGATFGSRRPDRRICGARAALLCPRRAHAGRHGADGLRCRSPRPQFLGIDVWMKPLKFEVALVVYL